MGGKSLRDYKNYQDCQMTTGLLVEIQDYQRISKIISGLPRLSVDYQDYQWITKIIGGLPRFYWITSWITGFKPHLIS